MSPCSQGFFFNLKNKTLNPTTGVANAPIIHTRMFTIGIKITGMTVIIAYTDLAEISNMAVDKSTLKKTPIYNILYQYD